MCLAWTRVCFQWILFAATAVACGGKTGNESAWQGGAGSGVGGTTVSLGTKTGAISSLGGIGAGLIGTLASGGAAVNASVSQGGVDSGVGGAPTFGGTSSLNCDYEGVTYPIGEDWYRADGCGLCHCYPSGISCLVSVHCNAPCGSHPSGSTWYTCSAANGCSICTCHNEAPICSSVPCSSTDCMCDGGIDCGTNSADGASGLEAGTASGVSDADASDSN